MAHRSTSPTPAGSVVKDPSAPPDLWTEQMLRAWKNAIDTKKGVRQEKPRPLVTLDELESAKDEDVRLSSPKSLQACLHLGIDPCEVVYRPFDAFAERGLIRQLQQIKYDHHENQRRDKLLKLKAERTRILENEETDRKKKAARKIKSAGDQNLLEKERLRMENAQRRQQRELEKMAKYEAARQQILNDNQARIDAQKKESERKKLEKAKKDKEWQEELRRRELVKQKEEEAMEKRSKQLAQERYQKEQEAAALEAEQERQMHKEIIRREQERLQKQEEFRKQLERAAETQQELLRKRQEEMHQKDLERQKLLENQQKERAAHNAEVRKQAEERHQQAIEHFQQLMEKRKQEYEQRQEELRRKLQIQEERHRQAELEKKRREELKEQQRLDVIREAMAERERRVQELVQRAQEADMMLQKFISQKQLDNARKMIERELEHEDKHARAESMRRVHALQRMQILQRIEAETERVRQLFAQRQQMQDRHRAANVNLSIHRQSMQNQMERLSINKKWRESLSVTDREELEQRPKNPPMQAIGE